MSEAAAVTLQSLVGEHMLDAVDFSTEQVKRWEWSEGFEDANCCRFRLDGVLYIATEDPDDGYRSALGTLTVASYDVKVDNAFPPIKVIGRHVTHGRRPYESGADVLELIDAKTGKTVLEVGTDNVGDYYPSFVASFHPEAMATNSAA